MLAASSATVRRPWTTGVRRPGGEPNVLPGDAVLDPDTVARAGRETVARALAEDLGGPGDVTARATIAAERCGRAELVARADGVVAGLWLAVEVYTQLDPQVAVTLRAADGDRVAAGDVLATVSGPLRSMLSGERTALNLVTHLSGVATATRALVDAVAGTGCVVRDTRKTLPGLRLLQKAAVVAGGGVNHRLGLSDALLVKDNHVAAAGSVTAAVAAALAGAEGRHVQVEVDSLAELEEAVTAGARDVLLDNLDPEATRQAVAWCRAWSTEHGGRILLESSGTIRHDTVRAYAEAGVDRVAVGAITHSAPQLDLALDITMEA
jgi:nicotinate-nucleotide pyrophosphorylase (carboxylating)